jgi:polar amino acid transport system substrate-binding protein
MRRRRGIVAGVAILAMVTLVASACAKKSTTTSVGGTSGTGPSGPTATTSATGTPVPQFTTLKSGELSVGSCLDYKPFEFTDPKTGDLTGFDIEMIDAIAQRLGLKVTWVKANFNTIFTALSENKFDAVAAASTITPKRQQVVDFSDPYFPGGQGFTVNTTKTPDITSTDDLKAGDVIGVQRGTTGEMYAQENLVPKGILLKTYTGAPDAFTDLENGRIKGVVNDEGSSLTEAASRPGLQVVQAIDTGEFYGFAVSKDNPGLLAAINLELQAVISDGTYTQIWNKWFPGNPVPAQFSGA